MCMWMCTQMRASVGSSCAKDYEGDREVQTMLGQEKLPQVEKELNKPGTNTFTGGRGVLCKGP